MTVPTRHQSPGAVVLGDHRAAVRGDLRDREPGVPAVGDLVQEAVVAAGRLRPALDDVPGQHRAGQRVPVVALPAVPPGGRPDREARVGDPGADDDVRAGLRAPRRCPSRPGRRWRSRPAAPALASGRPVSRLARSMPRPAARAAAATRSSPVMYAIRGGRPSRPASSSSFAASPAGLRPPALATTFTPRSRQVPSTSSIWRRNVVA